MHIHKLNREIMVLTNLYI